MQSNATHIKPTYNICTSRLAQNIRATCFALRTINKLKPASDREVVVVERLQGMSIYKGTNLQVIKWLRFVTHFLVFYVSCFCFTLSCITLLSTSFPCSSLLINEVSHAEMKASQGWSTLLLVPLQFWTKKKFPRFSLLKELKKKKH